MNDYLVVLRNEFEAGDGSFLIQIRSDLNWNKAAFTRLVTAMQRCCEDYAESDSLERWMANGFHYLSTFVRDWTTHPSFPQTHEPAYYQKAYSRLDDLAHWFFSGEIPYLDGHGFGPLQKATNPAIYESKLAKVEDETLLQLPLCSAQSSSS